MSTLRNTACWSVVGFRAELLMPLLGWILAAQAQATGFSYAPIAEPIVSAEFSARQLGHFIVGAGRHRKA